MSKQRYARRRVHDAFAALIEARQHMNIVEFEAMVRDNLERLGGRGFVASTGALIVHAAKRQEGPK